MNEPTPFPSSSIDNLVVAREHYAAIASPNYDEVLQEVTRRVEETKSIGKGRHRRASILEAFAS